MPPKSDRERSTESKLWCIKLLSRDAYLFKGGKKVPHFQKLLGAEVAESSKPSSVSGTSPTEKKTVKLEFTPSPNGSYQFAIVNPRYFNKFGCDGVFKSIESKTAEDIVEDIKNALKELNDAPTPHVEGTDDQLLRSSQKRPLTPIFTGLSEAKKQKGSSEGETGHMKSIQERCNGCQLDNMTHFIPIEKLVLPPRNRQIREVDDSFLKQLIRNMEEQPCGNYEALFVAVKGLKNKDEFNIDKIDEHEYEVLGGTHVTLATKQLHEKFPENQNYRGRVARIYIGLKDDEALWLGAMHNHTGSFRHQLTYRDEVEICRTQLFMPVQDCTTDPPSPPELWRDICSSLLNKPKRNLSEIFTMAQLPGEGWKHFLTLNSLYEKGELKSQKAKATDIVKKGKPLLRQWQLKPICKLPPKDQTLLLEKVAKCEMSLEELKCAATEIKNLRPIQEAITRFFKLNTWEEVIDEFGSTVSPEKLLQFEGKEFEQSHDFQKFLEYLKRKKDGGALEVADLVNGQLGALGLIIFSKTLLDVEQDAVAKLPHFKGAFLAIGEAGEHCKNASDVIAAISRINFTKLTSFNILLFTVVDEVKHLKDKMIEEGATLAQSGHFCVQNKPENYSKGPYLYFKESLNTFVVGHWSVSRQATPRHLSLTSFENVMFVDYMPSQCTTRQPLPVKAYTWLVNHLSREGDTVVEIESSTGYAGVAALKEGRNAVWVSTELEDNQETFKRRIANLLSSGEKVD